MKKTGTFPLLIVPLIVACGGDLGGPVAEQPLEPLPTLDDPADPAEDPPPVEEPPVDEPPVEEPPIDEPPLDPVGDFEGELPPVPPRAGVAYVAHYETSDLQIFRFDGDAPEELPSINLAGLSINATLDAVNDLYVVAHDVDRSVEIYAIDRPTGPEDTVAAPQRLALLELEKMPRKVLVDPYAHTLYVLVAGPETPLVEEELVLYDISDPSNPILKSDLAGATVPVTTSIDLDPVRKVLFLVGLTTDTLRIYDVGGTELRELPGGGIHLPSLYPEDNNFAFQARNLTVDPWNARVYAARSQSILSELIAFSYPSAIPANGAGYADAFHYTDLEMIDDGFEVALPHDERPNLLDAYRPLPDPFTGEVLLLADAWNGNLSSAIAVSLDSDSLDPAAGCADFEGFGCFLRSAFQGAPGGHQRTDGAACYDPTRRVLVTTSMDVYNPEDPGQLHLFSVDHDLGMQRLLPADGGNLAAGGLPIAAACH